MTNFSFFCDISCVSIIISKYYYLFVIVQVWIVGEYAERIDNADELLDSFLEGFHDENAQVSTHTFVVYIS